MKWIFVLLLFISSFSFGQIGQGDDSTKYIRYQNQYGMRMPRGWFDSVFHLPYYDTARFKPQKAGAIMMHLDKNIYKWNGGGWELASPPTFTLSNVGTGYALVTTPNGSIKRLSPGYGVLMDSTTTANSITITVDTSSTNHVVTQSDLNDAIAGASGSTNLDTTRTGTTVTVLSSTGNDAVILGASEEKAGVVTTATQDFAGRKNILGKTSNFNGYGPRLNTQLLVPAREADSIYAASRYRGFGFCGVFKSGVRVMVFVDADNHVGHHSIVMIGKSYDQGRTYSIDTLMAGLPDTCVTMGGGGIGPDNRLIIFYKRFLNADLSPVDQRMVMSDDEGETLYGDQVIGHGSNTEYLPYGGLVHCANDVLLLPWYGQNGSTFSSYVIRSTDGGLTWGSAITAFSNTTSQRTETSFEHLGGGTIIGLMRSEVGDTLYGQVISYDNGATWAYQGQVSFGINGTPAWLSAFKSQNGKMAVACYYRVGTDLRAIYSYADSVILGPLHWDLTKEVTVATDVAGSGYLNVCHPYQEMEGFGYYYDETVAQTNATIKWIKVPLGGSFPIGVATGVSGLTTGRIPVASSATALTDYSTLKYNSTSKSIVTTNTTPQDWADHNGGVIESSKNAIVLSENGYIGIHDNTYINSDYRYKASGAAAGLFNLTAGRLHFYNVGSGTAGNVISWTERLRIGTAGDYYFNGSAGTAGQVLVSGGAGSPSQWTTYTPSQWTDVLSGTSINYAGTKVGVHNATPRGMLDVIGNTSGSGNHTIIFEDDNSAIGMSMLLGYTSATGTNQRFKGFVMDNNGLNIVKALNNLTGVPTSIAMFSQADNFIVGSTSDNGARGQFNGDVTVADEAYDATAWNGSLEVPTKNAVRDKLETMVSSLNSQTGTVTISAGTAITTSTLSGDITIAYNKTSSDVPHTIATYLTDVNNSGTSETDLYNTTVGANKLISNGQSIHFVGTVAENDITATTQIRVYFAGTEIANTGGISISGTGYLKISGEIIRTTSTTARASFKVEGNGLTTDYVNEFDLTGLDFTTTNVFKVTGTAGGGGGGSNDITAKLGKLTFQSN